MKLVRRFTQRDNALTLGSSLLSSVTNAGAVLAGATLLGADELGIFSLIVMIALLASVLINAFTGEVLLGGVPSSADLQAAQAATWMLVLFATALVMPVALLVVEGVDAGVAVATVLAVVLVTLHAFARSVAFAQRDPMTALVLDAVWAIVLAGGFAFVALFSSFRSSAVLVAVWGIGAGIAIVWRSARLVFYPVSPRRAGDWFSRNGWFGASLAYGAAAETGTRNFVITAVAPVAGLGAVGGLRFTQTALGLSTVFFSAARNRMLPHLAAHRPNSNLLARLALMSGILTLVPIGAGLGFVLAEPLLARLINVETLTIATSLVLPVTASYVGSALTQGPQVGLRLLGAARALAIARTGGGALVVGLCLYLLHVGGVLGVAWGLAIANIVSAALWWALLGAVHKEAA